MAIKLTSMGKYREIFPKTARMVIFESFPNGTLLMLIPFIRYGVMTACELKAMANLWMIYRH
jgi:hypothetical protein